MYEISIVYQKRQLLQPFFYQYGLLGRLHIQRYP